MRKKRYSKRFSGGTPSDVCERTILQYRPHWNCASVRKSFGKTEIIRGVNLAVQAGERVAIIGPNGAGKSTLFNLISGRFAPTSGDVLLHGSASMALKPFEINRWACRAASRSPISSPTSACLRTCAAACCGAWATSTPS